MLVDVLLFVFCFQKLLLSRLHWMTPKTKSAFRIGRPRPICQCHRESRQITENINSQNKFRFNGIFLWKCQQIRVECESVVCSYFAECWHVDMTKRYLFIIFVWDMSWYSCSDYIYTTVASITFENMIWSIWIEW